MTTAVYATIADMVLAATGGWSELAQRAAIDPRVDGLLLQASVELADRSDWSLEVQALADAAVLRLNDALGKASRHTDTYLYPRYRQAMPLGTDLIASSDLPTVVATIALKRLYGTNVPDELRKGSQWADDYLKDLSTGRVSLGQLDTEVAPPAGAAVIRTPSKAFDWAAY